VRVIAADREWSPRGYKRFADLGNPLPLSCEQGSKARAPKFNRRYARVARVLEGPEDILDVRDLRQASVKLCTAKLPDRGFLALDQLPSARVLLG
jgi:hypothetical protein